MSVPHPAKFSPVILDYFKLCLPGSALVLDPFAGTGLLASIPGIRPVCVEIEPDWATQVCADAAQLPFRDATFDAVATSPTYGNRMADHHNAQDGSKRHTYTHYIGHKLHHRNSGVLQWSLEYRAFHLFAYVEIIRTLKPGGRFVLNMSDHYRHGALQPVTDWHVTALMGLGLDHVQNFQVPTPRNKHGANGHLRPDHETVALFVKEKL